MNKERFQTGDLVYFSSTIMRLRDIGLVVQVTPGRSPRFELRILWLHHDAGKVMIHDDNESYLKTQEEWNIMKDNNPDFAYRSEPV